jgi:carbon monoxide dehydrogenase subunit G
MLLENSFDVPARPEDAWDLLMDVPRVIPCMPGARLTETVDDSTWKASMDVKLGPVALTLATDVHREEADREAMRAILATRARDTRGRLESRARIESTLAPHDGGTRVSIKTDVTLSGAVAQSGRGMVEAVSAQLVRSFADCLRAQLAGSEEEATAAVAQQSRPVRGDRLAARALVNRIMATRFTAFVRRLTGRTRT